MTSFSLGFLFLFNLVLSLALAWIWFSLRSHQKKIEQRFTESIDDQDLAAFQESVTELTADLRRTSDEGVSRIEVARESLETILGKAEVFDKKISKRLLDLNKGQDKLDKRLALTLEKALGSQKSTSPKKTSKGKKTDKKNRQPSNKNDAAIILQALTGSSAPVSSVLETVNASVSLPDHFQQQSSHRNIESLPQVTATKAPRQRVAELAAQGLSKTQIAAATGLLPGEIELILNLKSARPRQ